MKQVKIVFGQMKFYEVIYFIEVIVIENFEEEIRIKLY